MTILSSMLPWLDRSPRRRSPRARRRCSLCLESLEDRSVPSAVVYSSGVVDVPVHDLQTSTSTISVPDPFAMGDVNVTLNITHSFDSDLKVDLVGPDGTTVLLFTGVGGSGNDFTNCTLDDQAATRIVAGAAPFSGSFRPAGTLADFNSHNAAGTWTLRITDNNKQNEGTLTSWSLSITAASDDFSNFFDTPQPITLSPGGSATQLGTIDYSFDVDVFQFTATASGFMEIHQDKTPGSTLDSYLEVYDANRKLIQADDDGGGALNSKIYFAVSAGQSYYLRAAAFRATSGNYLLTLDTFQDDFGDTFPSAADLALSASGSTSQSGSIERSGDVDMFRFVAPVSGILAVRQDAVGPGTLDSFLLIYDADKLAIGSDDNSGGGVNSQLQIGVTAGQTYYLRAGASSLAASGNDTGAYQLTLSTVADDFGNTFAEATAIPLLADDSGSQSGTIEVARDVDMFLLTPNLDGIMTVHQDAAAGSILDSFLEVYDSAFTKITFNDDSSFGVHNSLVRFAVGAQETYYLRALGFKASTGAYRLNITSAADDFGNTFAAASPITLSPIGSGSQSAVIEATRDVDVFRFVAKIDGIMTVRQIAAVGSALNSFLQVFAADQSPIASNDDSPGGVNSTVSFYVTTGTEYFLRAAASPQAAAAAETGAYRLVLTTVADDFGNTFDKAQTIRLDAAGGALQAGTIEAGIDVDVFRLTARVTGTLTIRLDAALGSSLHPGLHLFDDSQNAVAADDANGTSSRVQLHVIAGQTYYLKAGPSATAPANTDSGVYLVTITTEADNHAAPASPVALIIPPTSTSEIVPFVNQDSLNLGASSVTAVALTSLTITPPVAFVAPNTSGSTVGTSGAVVNLSEHPDYAAIFGSLPMLAAPARVDVEQTLFQENGLLVLLSGSNQSGAGTGDGPKHWPLAELFPTSERAWSFIATLLPATAAEHGQSDTPKPAGDPRTAPIVNDLDDLFLRGQVPREGAGERPMSLLPLPIPAAPKRVHTAADDADAVRPDPVDEHAIVPTAARTEPQQHARLAALLAVIVATAGPALIATRCERLRFR